MSKDFVRRVGRALDNQLKEEEKIRPIRDPKVLKMALMYRAVERFFDANPKLYENFMKNFLKEKNDGTNVEREVASSPSKR
jgi:hypothetical protein